MFLTPQHLQANHNFLADNSQYRFRSSNYANWGVTVLTIDPAALANGVVSLVRARGVMPDGLTFDMPDSNEAPAGRSITGHFQTNEDALDVYLAIPEQRPHGKNITHLAPTGDPPAANTRYVAENLPVVDENTDDEAKIVQVGRKNFRILFGDEILDGSTTLRIGRLVRDQAGQHILDPDFIAPCLDIASSEYLLGMIKRETEILRSKSGMLAAGRRQKGADLAEFSTSDVANFWLLHTVNTYLPELHHVWKTRRGHPEPYYLALLRLAGALSTFALSIPAIDLPEYDHDNLGACFTKLDLRVRTLLETVIPSKCIPVPLRYDAERSVWTGTVANERHLRDSQFFLAVSARLPLAEMIDRVPKLVKISAPDEIHRLVTFSLPGIGLCHTPAPPSAITLRLDNQYFSLDRTNALWSAVERSRSVSLFVPNEINDARIELLIVLR
jgi:type VI secretion system protein ImpJ